VAPPEDVEGIVGAIARLAADDDLRTSLAGKGRDFVAARYDRRRLAERYLGVLEALHARRACLDPIPSGRT
jgi:glycosyltransferase involved in cell wall biosynthesis